MTEFTDGATGVRITVEFDVPNAPVYTAYWKEDGVSSLEELNEAIRRLMAQAVQAVEQRHPPQQGGQAQ